MLGGSVQLAKSTSLYMESAHRNLSRGLNRLSTGVKLSNGLDDAGGLGVSMNIGAKLKKAFKVRENVQNARSFLEHQEAALSSMGKALDRMAELRTKYDDLLAGRPERELYNKEFKEMQSEMLSMRGRKFNGVSIFSTDPKDPMSFYIPTSEDGISTQVAINRIGFFDSLTIGSAGLGSTPATNVTGVVGNGGTVPASATNAGTVTPFSFSPTAGSMSNIAVNSAAAGTTTPFQLIPAAGAMAASTLTLSPEKLAAGAFVIGKEYKIDTPGITNFTLIGAANNTAGTVFTATGVGAGDGTVDAVTTATVEAVQGTGSVIENVTAFAGEEISILTSVTAGGNAAEIPAWTANPVTPNGKLSQKGVTDGSGNLWFVTDDGVVQKVDAGDPAAAGTGVLTTIPGLSGADYVSKPIILDVGGQDYLFVAAQNGPNDGIGHRINLATGARTQFTAVSGGSEKLRGLSEHNGKLYMAYSRSAGFGQTRGEIVRFNDNMSRDNTWGNGNGRVMDTGANTGWDFGNDGESRVEMAFSGGNLYIQMDNGSRSRIQSWDVASGTVSAENDFSDPGEVSSGVGGATQVHSPVIDGGNVYAAVDSKAFGGQNRIYARQLNGSAIAGWTDINLPGTEKVIQNPVINGANLYVSTDQGNVYSYNKTTGALVGNFASGSANSLTMPVFDGTDFYVGQGNGRVHKVDSATMSRDTSWPAPGVSAAGAIEAGPLVVGTEVYVGSPGRIQGFEAPAGGTTLTNKTNVAGGNDYLTTHSAGDTFGVTVKNNAGTLTNWTGTATVVNDGGVGKLNLTGFTGTDDLTGNVTVNVVSPPITPTLPASVSFGTNYAPLENPTITVTKPDSSTQALAAADVTNNGDGTLTVSLANVLMAGVGNYAVGASNGAIRLLPHGSGSSSLNDKGTGYAAGESVSFVSTSSSGITYGGAATATVDVAGRIDVDASGITPTSTGTLTLVFDGPLQGPATLTNVGSGYDTSETAPTVTITNGTGDKGTLAGTATINGDGTLNITFANNASAKGTLSVQAANGTFFKIPAENDRGTGYTPLPTPAPGVTVTRGGVPVVGVTGSGAVDAGGLVDTTFTGNAGSATPVDVSVANGSMSFATPSYTGQAGGYHTSETPLITITPTAGAAQTLNATVAVDGTLSFTMPTPNTTGAHTISAAAGGYYQVADQLNQGSGYNPGDTPTISLQRGGTAVAGLTANAVAGADGKIDITGFTGNAGNGAIDVSVTPGGLGFPTTTFNMGSGYSAGDTPTVTVTDPVTLLPVPGATVTVNGAGSLAVDISGVTPVNPGVHQVSATNGTTVSLPASVNAIGSGYSPSEPAPVVTVTDPASATRPGATATINANGTVNVNLTGVTPTTAGSYAVNVAGGTVSGVQQGLDDTSKDLWDFSHADFKKFIQTLTDVRAVNGATTSSLAFSESRLETNIQNLELAGGRIVDADMAEEMVEVAKSQILLQTATDSLSKHNKLSVDVDRTLMGLSGGR